MRYLQGNRQPDLLFLLKQEQDRYEFCQKQMAECDRQLAQYLQQREDRSQVPHCRKGSASDGSRRRAIGLGSTCVKGCFA